MNYHMCFAAERVRHYGDVIMCTMASQITSLTTVYSNVNSSTDQRKHQSSASLAFVLGIHRWAVNSPHKGPVTRKRFPFDDVIMWCMEIARVIFRHHGQQMKYDCQPQPDNDIVISSTQLGWDLLHNQIAIRCLSSFVSEHNKLAVHIDCIVYRAYEGDIYYTVI